MNPSPIIKDSCLLCGDGMTDDCNLCFRRNVGYVIPNPDYRKGLNWWHLALIIVGIILMFIGAAGMLRSAIEPKPTVPTPAPALSTQALYESQIRDLTHEINARENQLDTLVRALETTAAERDAALNLLSQHQRGQGL